MGLRKERLADEVRDIVANCFSGGQLRDPRLENVTITAVKLSGDLQLASVYFRVYGGKDSIEATEKGLCSAVTFLRRRLAQDLDLRRVPNLRFFYDESVERGSQMEHLLANISRIH
jgi:ribosome-binding factor A